MKCQGVIRLGPLDVRWPEQSDDRTLKRRREVSRSAVGRDQKRAATHTRFRQADRERIRRKCLHISAPRRSVNLSAHVLFARPTQNEHTTLSLVGQSSREESEVLPGPVFACAKGRTGIQTDDLSILLKSGVRPDVVRLLFVFVRREQLHAVSGIRASDVLDETIVRIDHRCRFAVAFLVSLFLKHSSQQKSTQIPSDADSLTTSSEPGGHCGAK